MRRVLSLFLVLIFLFSFVPQEVHSINYTRSVDLTFGNLHMVVDGKKVFNHKEPFIYNEDFYVSISDLARALDMAFAFSGNNVHLGSKGKLDPDPDGSNQTLVFQRGYEIKAKERINEILNDEIRGLERKDPVATLYKMKTSTRNVNIGFGNYSIYLDKRKLNLDTRPVKYNNDIFVCLDSIAPYLYITPSLSRDKTKLVIDANGILIKDNSFTTTDTLLAVRNSRNYLLDLQKSELDKRMYLLKDLKLPYKKLSDIKSLQDYLNRNFNIVGDLNVLFKVEKNSNWINLDISFPTSRNYHYYSLRRSDIEQWIWDIYTSIINLYDEQALISGSIRNPYYKPSSKSALKNYITFYSKDSDIYFDFSKSRLGVDNRINLGYLIDILNATLSSYSNVEFNYEASMSGDNLDLVVRPNTSNFSQYPLHVKMGYLTVLKQNIKNLYPELDVDGQIAFDDSKVMPLNFYISENRIRSRQLLDDTVKYLNGSFARFSNGNDDFALDYSIYEEDLRNFQLRVQADFSMEDEKWTRAGEVGLYKLNSNVHNALSAIFSIWDANIATEVFDLEGRIIAEFDFYQENVSVVSANPESGEIVEGEFVSLYTDTPGASIYYTTDGSTPTTSSQIYNYPITITKETVINAFGYKDNLGSGPISTFKYTVVPDESLSYGLTGLAVEPGILTPNFARNVNSYIIDTDRDSINITPYGTGEIKIDGDIIISGTSKSISLKAGTNNINISIKEKDKKERYYSIRINRESTGVDNIYRMEDLNFNTLFGLVFSGKISSSTVSNFSGYNIKLLTKSNKEISSISLSSNGEFSFPSMELDWFDKIVGFKYEVYDGKNIRILYGDLN